MRFGPGAFIRFSVFGLTALTALAIALGQGAPEVVEARREAPARYHGFDWFLFQQDDPVPRLLDVETGRIERVALPGSARLVHVACSPWRDARGQSQLVGLWDDADGRGTKHVSRALGLARYSFPERREIDRMPLEVMPVSIPCWYPGATDRILFAGADGRLYRMTFEDLPGGEGARRPDDLRRPRPLTWRGEPPGGGRVWLSDPSWPAAAELGGKLLVSLISWEPDRREADPPRAQVWWLRLSPDGTEIEEAGRLSAPDGEDQERWPAVASRPDGKVALAYLAMDTDQPGWGLRLAPVAVDPATGTPQAGRGLAVTGRDRCMPRPPIFSADGREVSVVTHARGTTPDVGRVDVSEFLGR